MLSWEAVGARGGADSGAMLDSIVLLTAGRGGDRGIDTVGRSK